MSFSSSTQLYLFQPSNQNSDDDTGMSAKEKKYGRNDLDHLQLCPRCNDTVPIRVEMDFKNRKVRWYCRRCEYSGNSNSALIREWVMADYCWPDPIPVTIRIYDSP